MRSIFAKMQLFRLHRWSTHRSSALLAAVLLVIAVNVPTQAEDGEAKKPAPAPRSLGFSLLDFSTHPVGRTREFDFQSTRIAVRDFEVPNPAPVTPTERFVLSTIGVEHGQGPDSEFIPLVAILVDQTFSETDGGQWLAVWNLGHKSPTVMGHVASAIPGYVASKKSNDGLIEKITQHRLRIEAGARSSGIPRPTHLVSDGHRGAFTRLTLGGIKTGWGFVNKRFWGQFLFRNYLLRRNDYLERKTQQTYLGLAWYSDKSLTSREPLSVSSAEVLDLKYRLLSNRSPWGGFTRAEHAEDWVHGYEAQLRDNNGGTSNRLAADANVHHLGFEEFHRFTEGGIPVPIGGILYYDPEIAPEPEQVSWSIANPFDLTYNPFTRPEVLEAAKDGRPVPLAIYTFQSNMSLKPIITVDFFSPSNPRIREAATYWRRTINEALASSGILGLVYNGIRRSLTYAANRKGLTWLSDHKVAMGVEELRLSLMGRLYFEPEVTDALLDRVDANLINPLIQSGREQRARARLHYQRLLANDGEEILGVARRTRDTRLRRSLQGRRGSLQASDYDAYRMHLRKQVNIAAIRRCASQAFVCSLRYEELERSLTALKTLVHSGDDDSIGAIVELQTALVLREVAFPGGHREEALQKIDETLRFIITTGVRGEDGYQAVVQAAAARVADYRKAVELRRMKAEARHFARQIDAGMEVLAGLVETNGDFYKVSPWYVERATYFLRKTPQFVSRNPIAMKKYLKRQKKLEALLAEACAVLESAPDQDLPPWLAAEAQAVRAGLLDSASVLRASGQPRRGQEVLRTSEEHR